MTTICEGCEQYLTKIDELNEELRSVKRSNIKLRKQLRYKSRKLQKLEVEKNKNTQHFRNNRKKDRNYTNFR
jgi:hypothetical protein